MNIKSTKLTAQQRINRNLIAGLIAKIDFNCQFVNGSCKRAKNSKPKDFPSSTKCCCVKCACASAYFPTIPSSFMRIARNLWSEKDGFWLKKGCRLPHKYRSITCLNFNCIGFARPGYKIVTRLTNKLGYNKALPKAWIRGINLAIKQWNDSVKQKQLNETKEPDELEHMICTKKKRGVRK